MQNKNPQAEHNQRSSSPLSGIRQVFLDWMKRLRSTPLTGTARPNSEDLHQGAQTPEPSDQESRNSDAVFVGWQITNLGEFVALYQITSASHPSHGSTVTDRTLRD